MGKVDGFGSGKVKAHLAKGASVHGGLSNKAAKFPDKSMGTKGGGSVNNDTTRSSAAPTPKSLGPRVA